MQLKVEPPGEVTIEHTEHVGGLFSSVWDRGGPGIRGVTIWSSLSSKGSSRVTGVVGLLLRLHRRLRRAQRRREVRLWPVRAGPRQTAPTKGGIDPESWHQLRGEEVRRQGRSVLLLPSLPPGSSSPLWGARRPGTDSTLRGDSPVISKGIRALNTKWGQ